MKELTTEDNRGIPEGRPVYVKEVMERLMVRLPFSTI